MPAPVITPGIPPIASIAPAAGPASTGGTAGASFGSFLNDAIAKVESFQQNADASVNRFLSGEGEEHAELSFDLFLQVRNKVVAAYEEVMRMQV